MEKPATFRLPTTMIHRRGASAAQDSKALDPARSPA